MADNYIDVVIRYSDKEKHVGKAKMVMAKGTTDPRFAGFNVEAMLRHHRENIFMQYEPEEYYAMLILVPIKAKPAPDLESHIVRSVN